MKIKRSASDWVIDSVIVVILVIFTAAIVYPFVNALAISLNDATDTMRGGITVWPRIFTIESYSAILSNPAIGRAYMITIFRTVVGTVMALFATGILSYGLAHSNLVGRKFYSIVLLVPMFFGAPLVSWFLMIRAMGFINNIWVYVIPGLVGLFNIILMRTFFQQLPEALEESARIDGANYLQIFFKIIIPISTPIMATIALFVGMGHWNDWFIGEVFMIGAAGQNLRPMQNVLMGVINEAVAAEVLAGIADGAAAAALRGSPVNTRSVTLATMFVTIAPVLVIYPFLQKYFIKGVMIGSVKG